MQKFLAAGVASLVGLTTLVAPASAQFAGVQAPVAATTSVTSDVQAVQYRDGYYRHGRGYGRGYHRGYRGDRHYRGRGDGVGVGIAAGVLGLAAGAAIGSAVANDRNDDRFCASRFRTYDPRSGTYMGADGYRHACP
jgi:hypothetical protein